MFDILIAILPFIIPTSIIGDNLSYIISSFIGIIYFFINIEKIKENKYFYICLLMFITTLITQLFISPYIESLAGSFLYLNMPIYYLVYKSIFSKQDENEVFKNIIIAILIVGIISLIYQGLYLDVRLYGNLGYANSYALLLLSGLYLNKIRDKDNISNVTDIILLILILYTGSRTTLILLLIYIGYDIYRSFKTNKKENINTLIKNLIISFILYILLEKLRLIAIFILPVLYILYKVIKDIRINNKIYYCLGIIGLSILLLSNTNTVNRIKNISLKTGTFQERLVYYEDSIKTIIENPLGNGINTFQYKSYNDASAFYDVKYIHNSFLQVLYDNGMINFILFMLIIIIGIISIIKSKVKYKNYLALAYISILGHSLLDFDLSFTTLIILIVFLIVLSEENTNNKKDKILIKTKENQKIIIKLEKILYSLILIFILYLGIVEGGLILGKLFLNRNDNLASSILKNVNKISFNKDYRGYFYRADALRNIYNEESSGNKEYLEEAIDELKISREINSYDPRVLWNISYLYEKIGDSQNALKYGQEVLEVERFYPGAYIKQYDYLMKLYGETEDKKYENQIKELEDLYYKNYKEINKKAIYMNNQLQENYDDIRSSRIDYNILLSGKYEKEVTYFNQEDEKWTDFPYNSKENNLGKTGCGVTAMAMIQSTMKENNITPIDMANYSIENGYCNNNTEVEFFDEVIKDDRYKLNLDKFSGDEISKVKRLLSDGKHMAVALMRAGDFTTEGHYLVLYGIETIDGINYFNVLDSNKDNNNYKNNGNIIYNSPKDGFIKVKASLFLEQCIEYWVYNI